jgi:O-antigen ligase
VGFIVGNDGQRARNFIYLFALSGLAYAAFGILSNIALPNTILFRPKNVYVGSVTGPFLSRNTAATFYGMFTILWLSLVVQKIMALRFHSFKLILVVPQDSRVKRSLVLRFAGLILCVLALLGTGSRGGIAVTAIAITCSAVLLLARLIGLAGRWIWLGGTCILVFGSVFFFQSVVGRIGSEGLFDRARWETYQSSIDIIRQFPWLGTGLGTFSDIFAQYRSIAVSSWGVWDYAHDTILEIAVEMGLPVAGLVAFSAILCGLIMYVGALRLKSLPQLSLLSIATVTSLALFHSLMDFSLQVPGFFVCSAILAGFGMSRALSDQPEALGQHGLGVVAKFREIFARFLGVPDRSADRSHRPRYRY